MRVPGERKTRTVGARGGDSNRMADEAVSEALPSDDESPVPNTEKGKGRAQPQMPVEVPGWAFDPKNDDEFMEDIPASW